ncbi:MAG TPA: TolC family protein [Usitatibacter sp.]
MKHHALVLVLVAVATGVAAADVPLTLPDAQRRAVDRSMQLVAQDAAISASRHMAVAAGQLPDPIFKAGLDNVPVSGPDRYSLSDDLMTMRRIGLMQEVTGSEKRQLRSARYELEAEKAAAEKSALIASIQRDTALAWLDRYYAEAILHLAAEQIAQSRLEIEGAEGAYRAGRGSQADVFNARASLALLEDRASEYRRRLAAAKVALARWIGEDAQRPLSDKPALDATPVHGHHLPDEVARHPMMEVLARQEQLAASEVKLASANRSPDWSIEVSYQNRGSAYPDMMSVGVSIPLTWDRPHRQDQELASKIAMSQQASAARADALQAHIAEVEAMVVEWDDDHSRLRRYEAELIPLAHERAEATLTAYRGAKASLADVLAARRGEIDMRMQALQLEMEAARLWAQLSFLEPDASLLPAKMADFQGGEP